MGNGKRNKNNLNFPIFMCGVQLDEVLFIPAQQRNVWVSNGTTVNKKSSFLLVQSTNMVLIVVCSGQPTDVFPSLCSCRLRPRPGRHTETVPQSIDSAPWPNAAALFQCARPMALISGLAAAVVGRDSREAPRGAVCE